MQNYDLLVDRIVGFSGLDRVEVEKRIEAKRAKLSGLISKEGAAQIVASELKINLEEIELKISELMSGMKKANVNGKIISLFPVREFEKSGKKGKVCNFIIADETGNVKVVLWDTNHIELVEKSEIKLGDVVEIKNASMRNMELHLSGFSEIKKSNKIIKEVKVERSVVQKEIAEVSEGQNVRIRGVVVQLFAPRFFNVCSECGKKVESIDGGFRCVEHGKILPKEKAILNLVIDDGSETIRAVLFSDQIEKLIHEDDLKNAEKLIIFREDLLGSEIYVSGSVKKSAFFQNLELSVSDIQKVDVEKLIEEIGKK